MDLSQTIETLRRENDHFFEACNRESDRGLALVAAEFMDITLEKLLLARFASGIKQRPKLVKLLFEGFGPLSTFSARIGVSYAFDLLEDWMASDLDLIRRIRNEFAHSLESKTFRDPEITRMVDQFACITKLTKNIEHLKEDLSSKQGGPQALSIQMSRIKFSMVSTRIGALLQAKVIVMESDAPDPAKRDFMRAVEG